MLREASMRLGALAMPKINIWPPTLLIGGGQVITSTPFWPLMKVLRKVFPPYPPQGQKAVKYTIEKQQYNYCRTDKERIQAIGKKLINIKKQLNIRTPQPGAGKKWH